MTAHRQPLKERAGGTVASGVTALGVLHQRLRAAGGLTWRAAWAAQAGGLGRLGEMSGEPGPLQFLDHEPPAGAALHRERALGAGNCSSNARNLGPVAGAIRPRRASPLSRSTQSKVIWARCTSNPPMMAIRDSFALRPRATSTIITCLSRGVPAHVIFCSDPPVEGATARSSLVGRWKLSDTKRPARLPPVCVPSV
jgi:hypothetical protein